MLAGLGGKCHSIADIRAMSLVEEGSTIGSYPNFGAAAPEPKDTLVLALDARDNVAGEDLAKETRLLSLEDGEGMRAGD